MDKICCADDEYLTILYRVLNPEKICAKNLPVPAIRIPQDFVYAVCVSHRVCLWTPLDARA